MLHRGRYLKVHTRTVLIQFLTYLAFKLASLVKKVKELAFRFGDCSKGS